jgi:hypothetical protein
MKFNGKRYNKFGSAVLASLLFAIFLVFPLQAKAAMFGFEFIITNKSDSTDIISNSFNTVGTTGVSFPAEANSFNLPDANNVALAATSDFSNLSFVDCPPQPVPIPPTALLLGSGLLGLVGFRRKFKK